MQLISKDVLLKHLLLLNALAMTSCFLQLTSVTPPTPLHLLATPDYILLLSSNVTLQIKYLHDITPPLFLHFNPKEYFCQCGEIIPICFTAGVGLL